MRVAVVLMLIVAAGCSGDNAGPSPGPSRAVRFAEVLSIEGCTGATACQMDLGTELVRKAVLQGDDLSTRPVAASWRVEQPGVATVDAEGRVRAVGVGDATVIATAGSLTARRPIAVISKSLGEWAGDLVLRSCTTTGDLKRKEWCDDYGRQEGERWKLSLSLRGHEGRLTGGVSFNSGFSGLEITSGTLQADGRIELVAEGELGLGPCCARVELKGWVRGESLEGRLVLTETWPGWAGSSIVEGELDGVTKQ